MVINNNLTKTSGTKPQVTKPLVIWEKWASPYGENINDIEMPGWNSVVTSSDKDNKDDNNTLDANDLMELENSVGDSNDLYNNKPTRIIATQSCIIPLTEYTDPAKVFNFWSAHTNFKITKLMRDRLDIGDNGVETLDIFTKYRMRIGIGKAFDAGVVKSNIQQTLYDIVQDTMKV